MEVSSWPHRAIFAAAQQLRRFLFAHTVMCRPVLILAPVAMLGFGALALWLGQDASFDQLNYHFYGPWALLHRRLLVDVFPAFTRPTFHNPSADVPFYLLAAHAPPRVTGFVLGAVHGLAAVPLYLIARALVPENRLVAPLIVLAGMASAMSVAETGTTFGDDLTATLVLGGLAAAIVMLPQLARSGLRHAAVLAFVAAVPAGVAAGLKLTAAIYGAAFALAFLAIRRDWHERGALVVASAAGVGAGLMVAGGPWFLMLWQRTGNPTFPYLNQIFQSALALPISHRDDSFVPEGFVDTVLFPFLVALGRLSDAEFPFRDLRVPVLYGLVLLFLLARLFGHGSRLSPAARLALTFAAACYVPWLAVFAIARYLLPIEQMSPALITVLIGALVPRGRSRTAITALALGLIPADRERQPRRHGGHCADRVPHPVLSAGHSVHSRRRILHRPGEPEPRPLPHRSRSHSPARRSHLSALPRRRAGARRGRDGAAPARPGAARLPCRGEPARAGRWPPRRNPAVPDHALEP